MTLRFAAARPAALTSTFARTQVVRIAAQAANDNGDGEQRDAVLRAALKHFAVHGLAAAADARDKARTAHYSGRREDYRHWLGICRTLDRRMAVALSSNLAKRGPG
jgi:hypothetical protein